MVLDLIWPTSANALQLPSLQWPLTTHACQACPSPSLDYFHLCQMSPAPCSHLPHNRFLKQQTVFPLPSMVQWHSRGAEEGQVPAEWKPEADFWQPTSPLCAPHSGTCARTFIFPLAHRGSFSWGINPHVCRSGEIQLKGDFVSIPLTLQQGSIKPSQSKSSSLS